MEAQTIIFIGSQGSGKGTQVERLVQHFRDVTPKREVLRVQTGDWFRELMDVPHYTGARIQEIMNAGELVPDFFVEAHVTEQFINELTAESHIIMDGFPRNLEQAKYIDDLLAFYLRPQVTVLHLNVPEAIVRQRMAGRGRSDDTDDVITKRLELFAERTKPVLEHYQKRPSTRFVTIDGTQSIDQVTEAIINALR